MNKIKTMIPSLVMTLSGALFGMSAGAAISESTIARNYPAVELAVLLLLALAAIYVHIIMHELGHLIAGLVSGYGFVSFRVGSLTLIKENGKYRLKRYSLAGTGGQCLMSPPEYNDGRFPYVLYNLGGIIMNLILLVVFALLYKTMHPTGIAEVFCLGMIIFGAANAIINGVPLQTTMITNDGHNALNLSKNQDALKTFWAVLKINAKQLEGSLLSDMNPEWLQLSDGADLRNPVISSLVAVRENLLMEQGDFDGAKVLIEKLLSDECALSGLHEGLLKLDALYIDLVQHGTAADTSVLQEKALKKYMKMMKNHPSVLRTNYVLARVQGDEKTAARLKAQFEKIAKTYPYRTEIETERKRMEAVR